MRTAAIVALAIALCAPTMPRPKRAAYAVQIVADAAKVGVDPILVVALVEHESRWRKGAVSRYGEDYGLGQIRARYLAECARPSSRRCLAVKRRLLQDAAFNLRETVRILGAWRRSCRTTEAITVSGYASGKCGPVPRAAREILDLKADLLRRLKAI